MSGPPTVLVHPDDATVAAAVAARLLTVLVDVQSAGRTPSVVVPGGTIGIAALAAVRSSPARGAVDWRRVELWWGDERFVEADSPDRNELQAREALLDALDLDPALVHPMGALGGPDGDDADAAGARYATELGTPAFDVLLLGMGPEGHTASIFPHSPASTDERAAFGVHDCPKPPPTRVSMGFSALQSAREVWVLATGAAKADALAQAHQGASQVEVPIAGGRGRERTLWFLDEAAASLL